MSSLEILVSFLIDEAAANRASIAQWQSVSLVNRRSWAQSPVEACLMRRNHIGDDGRDGNGDDYGGDTLALIMALAAKLGAAPANC